MAPEGSVFGRNVVAGLPDTVLLWFLNPGTRLHRSAHAEKLRMAGDPVAEDPGIGNDRFEIVEQEYAVEMNRLIELQMEGSVG